MITITIKTKSGTESLPCMDSTRVKEITQYLFNNYTSKGIDYKLKMRKNKELN